MPHPARRHPRALAALLLSLVLVPLTVLAAQTPATATTPDCASAGYAVTGLGGPNFYIDASDAAMRSGYTGYRVVNQTGAPSADLYVRLDQFAGGALGLASGQAAAQRLGDLAPAGGQSLFWYLTATGATSTAQGHTLTVYRHDPSLSTSVPLCTTTGGFSTVSTTISASANKVTGITLAGGTPKLGSTFTVDVSGNTGTIGSGIAGDSQSFWMTPAVAATWPADAFRLLSTTITMSPDGTAASTTTNDRLRLAGLGSSARDYTASYTFRAVGFTSGAATVQPVQQISSGTQIKHTGSYSVGLPAIAPPVNDLTMTSTVSPTKLPTGGGTATYAATVTGTAGAQLDGVDLLLPAGASVVPGTATWAGQSAGEPVLRDGRYYLAGPFVVPSGGGELDVEVEHGPTPGPQSVAVRGVVGPSYIGTTATVLDGSNAASSTVQVNRAPGALNPQVVTDSEGAVDVPMSRLATDADGDPLTVTSVSAPDAAVSVVGGQIHFHGAPPAEGEPVTYTVVDDRGGSVAGTVLVLPYGAEVVMQDQTIGVDESALGDLTVDGTLVVPAATTSGLAPVFTSQTPDVCTVDADGTVTALTVGACSIAIDQPGDSSTSPAPQVVVSLDVRGLAQHIAGSLAPTATVGDVVAADALASSTLPVTWSSTTPAVCTVDAEGAVTAVAPGECHVVAEQAGDERYAAAAPLELVSTVSAPEVVAPPAPPTAQTITLVLPARALAGPTALPVGATATSALPVTLAVESGPCTVSGGSLVVTATGSCAVVATQAGDATYAAAPAVRATVLVVAPRDDVVGLPAGTRAPVSLGVLGNDPAGLTVTAVGAAQHGATTLAGGTVRYRPTDGYRGTDQFTYTVRDALGRTARATVTLTVANAAPTVTAADVAQVAGSTLRAPVTSADANGDSLALSASTAVAGVQVAVADGRVVVTPGLGVSGRVTVTVTVADGAGGVATATFVDLVSPRRVDTADRYLTVSGTRVTWSRAATVGARYDVVVDGRVVCTTADLACRLDRIAGPALDVDVVVRGLDGTRSGPRPTTTSGDHRVLMATVYFAPGKHALTAAQSSHLRTISDRILALGFRDADIAGYTDSDGSVAYNVALSHRRTRTVGDLLGGRGIRSTSEWYGMDDPAAPNTTVRGKAANRRVEIYVGF